MSARRQTSGRSRVLRMGRRHGAASAEKQLAIGFPTMFERPTTTASSPARSVRTDSTRRRQPSGVQGTKPGSAGHEPPGIHRMEAVDVLGRIDGLDHGLGVDLWRQRKLHQDAVDLRIGIEPGDQREEFLLGSRGRQHVIEDCAFRLRRSGASCCARRSGSPDPRRPERPRGRGSRPPGRSGPRPRRCGPERQVAKLLPSMMAAVMQSPLA